SRAVAGCGCADRTAAAASHTKCWPRRTGHRPGPAWPFVLLVEAKGVSKRAQAFVGRRDDGVDHCNGPFAIGALQACAELVERRRRGAVTVGVLVLRGD